MKVEKRTYEPHPEGWFLFLLGEPEEVEATWNGETKTRLKWPCFSSTVKGEDGEDLVINLFTGVAATEHPSDKHRALAMDGFGLKFKDYEDTDQISGKFFAGKVEKDAKSGRHAIVAFDTKERCRPEKAGKSAKPKAEVDPFAEE